MFVQMEKHSDKHVFLPFSPVVLIVVVAVVVVKSVWMDNHKVVYQNNK